MRHDASLQHCHHQVDRRLSALPRPERTALALAVTGTVAAQSGLLPEVATAVAADLRTATADSTERRLRRLLNNDRFVAETVMDVLASELLAGRRGRVAVTIDLTTTPASAKTAGLHTLMITIGTGDRAQPAYWHTWTYGDARDAVMPEVRSLLLRLREQLPPHLTPVLMSDRGFSGSDLVRLQQDLGWHLLIRVPKRTRIRRTDGSIQSCAALVETPGAFVGMRGVQLYGPKSDGRPGSQPGCWPTWDDPPRLNVVAMMPADAPADPAMQDPWLLVTDLPPTATRCTDYRHRTRIEACFRDLKSQGWHWERSLIRHPRRVERLLVVLALATRWVTLLGQRVIKRGERRAFDPRPQRRLSVFRLGWRWMTDRRQRHLPVPCLLPFATTLTKTVRL
jgi:hypothetical protein